MPTEERQPDYELMDRAKRSRDIILRDDQHEFAWLRDAVRSHRKTGGRFLLIDSGRFSAVELEWLAEAGVGLHTSDDVRPGVGEVVQVQKAGRRAAAHVTFLVTGDAADSEGLAELARSGVALHISNRERKRPRELLLDLARACRSGGGRLVYYHHGPLVEWLEELAAETSWIHLTDESLDPDLDHFRLKDILRAARRANAGLLLHVEKGLPVRFLKGIARPPAFLLFQTPRSERSSGLRRYEEWAAARPPDPQSYYLYSSFMP